MSRCFPFPPPGYEKKIKPDEADLLTKEKNKEKKHKKDKKDKEKKEGKEKKDKERSKDKHKERKERKEKHKDTKDKGRDKEKNRNLEEKKAEVLPNPTDTKSFVTNTLQNNSNGDSRFVQDLARRIRDGEAATGSQSEQKTKVPDHRNARLSGKAVENNSFYPVQETNHRRGDDDKRINSQRSFAMEKSAENVVAGVSFGTNQKRAEGIGKPVERKDQEKQMESLEKNQHKESVINNDKPRDKEGLKKSEHKDKDRSKEKKEEKSEVLLKVGHEKPKFIEGGPRLKERDKDSLDIRNSKLPDLSRASNKNLTCEGNLGKRKDLERNGFLYENGSNRPNKFQRLVASPISSGVENGRKLGTARTEMQSLETKTPPNPVSELQSLEAKTHPKPVSELKSVEAKTPPKHVSELQGTSCKSDVKEHRVNGIICSRGHKDVMLHSLAAPVKVKVKENGEASVKLPHPDLKWLDQVLSVPQKEDLPQFDDQEWLFGDSTVKLKKPRTESPASDETGRSWDKAFRIESADISALPYVVPL